MTAALCLLGLALCALAWGMDMMDLGARLLAQDRLGAGAAPEERPDLHGWLFGPEWPTRLAADPLPPTPASAAWAEAELERVTAEADEWAVDGPEATLFLCRLVAEVNERIRTST